jgi:hypothetical protein
MDTEKIVAKYGTDITKLNIANVRKWVRALRSGKYHQTVGELYTDSAGRDEDISQPKYCVLGVAAHLSGLSNNDLEGMTNLPEDAMEWLGVDDSMPTIGPSGAADRNDSGQSFGRIANDIEHYWIKPYDKYKHCFLKQRKGDTK